MPRGRLVPIRGQPCDLHVPWDQCMRRANCFRGWMRAGLRVGWRTPLLHVRGSRPNASQGDASRLDYSPGSADTGCPD